MAFDNTIYKRACEIRSLTLRIFTGLTEEEEVVMKRSGHVNAQEEIAEIVSC